MFNRPLPEKFRKGATQTEHVGRGGDDTINLLFRWHITRRAENGRGMVKVLVLVTYLAPSPKPIFGIGLCTHSLKVRHHKIDQDGRLIVITDQNIRWLNIPVQYSGLRETVFANKAAPMRCVEALGNPKSCSNSLIGGWSIILAPAEEILSRNVLVDEIWAFESSRVDEAKVVELRDPWMMQGRQRPYRA